MSFSTTTYNITNNNIKRCFFCNNNNNLNVNTNTSIKRCFLGIFTWTPDANFVSYRVPLITRSAIFGPVPNTCPPPLSRSVFKRVHWQCLSSLYMILELTLLTHTHSTISPPTHTQHTLTHTLSAFLWQGVAFYLHNDSNAHRAPSITGWITRLNLYEVKIGDMEFCFSKIAVTVSEACDEFCVTNEHLLHKTHSSF